jgi:hypothetical protein
MSYSNWIVPVLGVLALLACAGAADDPKDPPAEAAEGAKKHGFPILPPIADADPDVRELRKFRLPASLRVTRDDDGIGVEIDADSLQDFNVEVGHKMVTGFKHELRVYRGKELVAEGHWGLTGGDEANIGGSRLNRKESGIPQPGEDYTVEIRLTLFETDIPTQHFWRPAGGRYKELLTMTLSRKV